MAKSRNYRRPKRRRALPEHDAPSTAETREFSTGGVKRRPADWRTTYPEEFPVTVTRIPRETLPRAS